MMVDKMIFVTPFFQLSLLHFPTFHFTFYPWGSVPAQNLFLPTVISPLLKKFICVIGQRNIESGGRAREGKRKKDTWSIASLLVNLLPAGGDQELEPWSLHMVTCVLN